MFPHIDWTLISLEVLMTLTIGGLFIMDILLSSKTSRDWLGWVSYLSMGGLLIFWLGQSSLHGMTFNEMFVMDKLAWMFKTFFLLTAFFVLVISQQFFKNSPDRRNQFYILLWFALLGMCLIASSADFLLLFIAIEIMTISFYVMTAYIKSDKLSIEAGMKYLILGGLASGFFLYGVSFLYGVTHSTHFSAIAEYSRMHTMSPFAVFGLLLIFATVGFKIASAPFQLWVPDVYQGAPTPVTAFLSVGSKAAGFVILLRLFSAVFAAWQISWVEVFAILSAVTMCYGNLGAMFQTNIKRLLGYSSIGHAGYLLMGVAAGSIMGTSAVNFYLWGYLFTNLAAFLVIVLVFNMTKSDDLSDYNGLSQRSGLLAFVLLLALVSLAGIPPLVGFFGKFYLLMAVIQSGLIWLALIAVVNIVIATYYYLKVIKRIYVDHPQSSSTIIVPSPLKAVFAILIVGMIALGIYQGPLVNLSLRAVQEAAFLLH